MSSLSEIIIKSENGMQKLGKFLSNILEPYDIITFNGDVGAGKTFLCRSIINNIRNKIGHFRTMRAAFFGIYMKKLSSYMIMEEISMAMLSLGGETLGLIISKLLSLSISLNLMMQLF